MIKIQIISKISLTFLLITFLNSSIAAKVLTGGVIQQWSINTAQKVAFATAKNQVDLSSFPAFDPDFAENIKAVKNKQNKVGNRTLTVFDDESYVVHIDDKNVEDMEFYYARDGKLERIGFWVFATNKQNYPVKKYKHSYPDGILRYVSLAVSKYNSYEYTAKGELLGHWEGMNCYDKTGKIIMTRYVVSD